jgi:hypothetical protein
VFLYLASRRIVGVGSHGDSIRLEAEPETGLLTCGSEKDAMQVRNRGRLLKYLSGSGRSKDHGRLKTDVSRTWHTTIGGPFAMCLHLTRLATVPHHVGPGDKRQGVKDMVGLP